MNFWIINPYGNLPGEGWRDYRSTMIANALGKSGHKSVWWVSNFEHRTKTFRSEDWKDISINPQFKIRIVPSKAYTSHISLKRIYYEKTFAKRVRKQALQMDPPDAIILAEPALFTSGPILDLVRQWKVKLIVDIIDLWPELFYISLPKKLNWTGKFIFAPLYLKRMYLFRKADAIFAVTKDYLSLAQRIAPYKKTELVYWGVDTFAVKAEENNNKALDILKSMPKLPGEIWIIYAGTLGDNYDICTILKAAEILESEVLPIKILIIGEGPLKELLMSTIIDKKLSKIVFLGKISADVLTSLYSYCDIALSSYVAGSTVSMPIKAFDYMTAGLPIINSLGRDLGEIVHSYHVGLQYEPEKAISLANAMRILSKDTDMRRTMAINALKTSEIFDIKLQYTKLVKFLEKVCKE